MRASIAPCSFCSSACTRFDGGAPSTGTDRSRKKVVTRNDLYYQEDSGVPVRRP
ncbi:hypothetical protein HMPREF9057_01009 [Actinomyces sp. oral taxon 171 str. F0337]|nr:hypothetical protein HMPREF9057_01009 [Actinomyces sp. oral taxon 171 str. F0337]